MIKQQSVLLQKSPLQMALEAVGFPVNPVGKTIEVIYREKGFSLCSPTPNYETWEGVVDIISQITNVEFHINNEGGADFFRYIF